MESDRVPGPVKGAHKRIKTGLYANPFSRLSGSISLYSIACCCQIVAEFPHLEVRLAETLSFYN